MKQFVQILVVSFTACLAIACSKTDMKTGTCYPTQFLYSDSSSRTLIYNSNNQVILDTRGEVCNGSTYYNYDQAGNIISSVEANGTTSYTYDGNNNLIQQDYGGVTEIVYQYNSTGQLTSATVSATGPCSGWLGTKTYQYPNATTRNPSIVTVTSSCQCNIQNGYCCPPTHTFEYEYDNKPNPMKVLFPSIQTDNNVISGGTTYQYNANGYPTSSVTTVDYNGTPYTTSTTITYDCK